MSVTITCFRSYSQSETAGPSGPGDIVWSETQATGAFTNKAPASGRIRSMVKVYSPQPVWLAYGATPDAVNGPKVLLVASMDYWFYPASGDSFACAVA